MSHIRCPRLLVALVVTHGHVCIAADLCMWRVRDAMQVPAVCTRGLASLDVWSGWDLAVGNVKVEGAGYLHRLVSMHVEGRGVATHSLRVKNESTLLDLRRSYILMGDQTDGIARVAIGRTPVAHGIEHYPLPGAMAFTRDGWPWPKFGDGVFAAIEDVDGTLALELSGGLRAGPDSVWARRYGAVRLRSDIPAAFVTRVVVSYLSDAMKDRRISLAVMNFSRAGDRTSVEWIANLQGQGMDGGRYRQGLVIAYESAFRANGRWVGAYEQETSRHRTGTAGFDVQLVSDSALVWRNAVRWTKADVGRLTFLTGMEARW